MPVHEWDEIVKQIDQEPNVAKSCRTQPLPEYMGNIGQGQR
jgi:hypothetical protein